LFFGYFFSGR
jgi:hypothetical protein